MYKILNGVYDPNVPRIVKEWKDMAVRSSGRGHSKKLFPQHSRLQLRKNSFALRVVQYWNDLPESVVSAPSVDSFKARLDKIFCNTDIYYDNYKIMAGSGTNLVM